jgi:Fur family transcriptional regulator, stress-responsive regulator
VRRIEPAGHPARFETRTADNHHHLVCRVCGRTEDVGRVVAPCLEPSNLAGSSSTRQKPLCPGCARGMRLAERPRPQGRGHICSSNNAK